MDRIARSLLLLLALLAAIDAGPARAEEPKVVLLEDPTLNATRLHYPLLISEGRGYRIRCNDQADEEAVIRGLGFATVPSQVLTVVDNAVVAADPASNPLLCPFDENYPIKVFAHDGGSGLVYYLQFPTDFGSTSFSDQLYIPGCAPLVAELNSTSIRRLTPTPPHFSPERSIPSHASRARRLSAGRRPSPGGASRTILIRPSRQRSRNCST